MSRFVRQYRAILGKDLRVELRTREILYTAVLFSAVLVTLFVFSGFETAALVTGAAPGVMWVSIAFVGTLVFSRTFQRERDEGAIEGLLLVPGIIDALYLAKLTFNLLLLGLIEAVLVPLVVITFRMEVEQPGLLVEALALGTLGFCALGTVLAAALASVKLREVLLPLVLYPLCIPLLVAGVRSTSLIASGDSEVGQWFGLMLAFDALFIALGRWLFGEAVDSGEA